MPESEFANMVQEILEAVPEEHIDFVRENIEYANELKLRERIKELFQPIQEWLGNSTSRKAFISQYIDTRNYLTHYDKERTPRRAEGPENMLKLQRKLEGVIQLVLLERTGFDTEQVDRIVQENSNLRTKLGLEGAD